MNVSVVDLILPRMTRTFNSRQFMHLRDFLLFCPKATYKARLKHVKSENIAWMLLQVHARRLECADTRITITNIDMF